MTTMHRGTLMFALALGACSGEPSAEERAAQEREDAAAVATVEAAQTPPLVPVAPAAITFADVERDNLFGAGCSFATAAAPADVLALARNDGGFIKVDQRIERFAPDAGSEELPYNARARYTSTQRTFELELDERTGRQSGSETTDYSGSLTIRDENDRIAYRQRGTVQCGA